MTGYSIKIETTDLETRAAKTAFWSVDANFWVETREEATVFATREDAQNAETDVFGGGEIVEA